MLCSKLSIFDGNAVIRAGGSGVSAVSFCTKTRLSRRHSSRYTLNSCHKSNLIRVLRFLVKRALLCLVCTQIQITLPAVETCNPHSAWQGREAAQVGPRSRSVRKVIGSFDLDLNSILIQKPVSHYPILSSFGHGTPSPSVQTTAAKRRRLQESSDFSWPEGCIHFICQVDCIRNVDEDVARKNFLPSPDSATARCSSEGLCYFVKKAHEMFGLLRLLASCSPLLLHAWKAS